MAELALAPRSRWRPLLARGLVFLILALLALLIGAVAVAIAGESPLAAVQELVRGALGTKSNVGATLTRAIPIIVSGIGAAVAFRAGMFNLGVEGQMVAGALVSAIVATTFPTLPPLILLPLTILSGCLAGGLLALPTAWWQTRYKVPLLITTLLLNYVISLFATWVVTYPLRDTSGGSAVAQTVMIPESIRLPVIWQGTRLHAGVVVLIVLPLLVAWFFRRTSLGYRLRITGLNPDFAEYGGVPMARTALIAMFLSGAISGLAGAIQVLGVDFRFISGSIVTAGFAWTGFIAAILALSNPLTLVVTGLFLAALKVGAAGMQRNTQVPLQIADVVQAGIIFMVAVRYKVGEVVRRILVPS